MENSENSLSGEEGFGDREILLQYYQRLRAVEMAKRNGEDPLTAPDMVLCGVCDATFNRICDYNRHLVFHEYIQTRISCPYESCLAHQYNFCTKQTYFRHMARNHNNEKVGIMEFTCYSDVGTPHILSRYIFGYSSTTKAEENQAIENACNIYLERFGNNGSDVTLPNSEPPFICFNKIVEQHDAANTSSGEIEPLVIDLTISIENPN